MFENEIPFESFIMQTVFENETLKAETTLQHPYEFIDENTLQHRHESKSKARVRERISSIFCFLVQLQLLPIELHLELLYLLSFKA